MSAGPAVPSANFLRSDSDFSTLTVLLFKGVVYREVGKRLWRALVELQDHVRDYVGVLGLDLVLDEEEGYALLRPREEAIAGEAGTRPELIPSHEVALPTALLACRLRRALADFDAHGGASRLILTRTELGALLAEALAARDDEARLSIDVQAHADRLVQLGFLRRLASQTGPVAYEVQRVLRAIVDPPWLLALERRLAPARAAPPGTPRP